MEGMTCESRRDMKKQFFKASKSDQSMKREEIIHTILVFFYFGALSLKSTKQHTKTISWIIIYRAAAD